MARLTFAWDVVRHVKSNGVVIARDGVTRGICAGQTNRVSAVRIAGERAGADAIGSGCASDGFFPFSDGLEAAVEAGCSAIIAPGGSIRDADVIAAADRLGVALVFSTSATLALAACIPDEPRSARRWRFWPVSAGASWRRRSKRS